MFLTRIILPLCIVCTFASSNSQDTVKVSLYYEALCPYSQEFIKDQLFPGYQVLGDVLDLDLVPYGKAKMSNINGKWKLTCQHGPKECFGNKIQACVLDLNYTQAKSMNFIGCVMSTETPENKKIAKKCAEKNKLSWTDIKLCMNGEQVNEIMEKMGNKTNNLEPKMMYVPYILFNDIHDDDVEDEARENFLKTVCKMFKNKPPGCSDFN
ncbi:unnamed protein product [Phaedon cochleariae]|uniref:Uncharacterized protein n=1 Tax=Phaedon cochleariae TaxID=80249 RepID=A0A9P0DGN5_PHACE|nr:unnamed protein product [Phaedon cochleariae]